jgi:hypothetical protein
MAPYPIAVPLAYPVALGGAGALSSSSPPRMAYRPTTHVPNQLHIVAIRGRQV